MCQSFRQEAVPMSNMLLCYPPAILRVRFAVGNSSAVVPLHCTTVPFSLFVVVKVRVEVMSATVPPVELVRFVRVATKSKSAHCKVEIALQSKLLPNASSSQKLNASTFW